MGQLFCYLTKSKSAAVYCGNGTPEAPTMKALDRLTRSQIEKRVCGLLGCPLSRMRILEEHDNDSYEKIVTFWQLLRSRRRLLRSMRSALARRGDILLSGGPMPHYGSGCKKGVLRLLAFATFGEQYDVDSQASRSPVSSVRFIS